MNAGLDFAAARHELGLSLDQVAASTQIGVERLTAIEQMDVENLPDAASLHALLETYASAVRLSPRIVTQYLVEVEEIRSLYADILASASRSLEARDFAPTVTMRRAPARRPGRARAFLVGAVVVLAVALVATNLERLPGRAEEPVDTAVATQEGVFGTDVDLADAAKAANVEPIDVSGAWTLLNRIESSTHDAFNDLALGFEVELQQDGTRVTGSGEKVAENGTRLPETRRTPIVVEGTLDGRRLELTFIERGGKRSSGGSLSLEVSDEDTLRGTFASDAAKTRGTSLGQRLR